MASLYIYKLLQSHVNCEVISINKSGALSALSLSQVMMSRTIVLERAAILSRTTCARAHATLDSVAFALILYFIYYVS